MTEHGALRLRVGDVVHVRFAKWGEHRHWEMDLRHLGEDEHGTWLGAPLGLFMSRPGMSATTSYDMAMLVPRGRPFVASFNGRPHDWCDIYVDITTVPTWEGPTMRAVDLDLDVFRRLDGTVAIDDEDEFEEHQVTYGYPGDVIDLARRSCAEVAASIRADAQPWAGVGHRWVEVASHTQPVGGPAAGLTGGEPGTGQRRVT